MYVLIAVVLTSIVLALCTNCWILPVFFMLSIGMAIVYNMGTNYFLGEISYITKALSAVLQLGVTMDYSIFLWHSYQENQERFPNDKRPCDGTCHLQHFFFRFGKLCHYCSRIYRTLLHELHAWNGSWHRHGKGVVFGVLSCVTILPSFILVFDKWIEKNFTPLPHS